MNVKRFVIASVAVFVVFEIINFIVNWGILMPTYDTLKSVWRPDMMEKMWIMYIVDLVLSFLFVYIFTKGYEGKGVPEGVRYGILIGLLVSGTGSFMQYAIYPLPFTLVLEWFVFGLIQFIIVGIIAALIYKPAAA